VIGAVGLALFDLYALSLPGLYRRVRPVATTTVVDAGPGRFWQELGRGLGQAFGDAGVIALVVLAVLLAFGMVRFVRRRPIYCTYLVAPLAALGAAVLLLGLFAAPRYFGWAVVPFSIALIGSATMWPRGAGWVAPVVAGLIVTGSLVGLRDYHRVPFQASRESVEWILQESAREDVVVPVALATAPTRYYGRRLGLFRARTVSMAYSITDLRSIERAYPGRRLWLVTTKQGDLVRFKSDLADHIDRCYRPVRNFPAKVRGMQISVWRGRCVAGARKD